ncbi:hypothetical protein [Photobacterium sp. 1_MG-2023]|uniref:hypothetical protein n=1 Tax=Photobacterium sp. 1_MG-2023 TaxID=3062646 RepID=UPI0026E31BB1|nr:hypothetical protein [Photobacterium sp. 1_MG-2023]MDO6708526.1 hypothetical protein [Photobacterium sp. 1_MG-2023]
MNKIKLSLTSLLMLMSTSALANAPEFRDGWQWNTQVSIQFIYGFWNNNSTQVRLSNGEFCYIKSTEKELLSIVLAMRAQNATGDFVCTKDADSTVDGKDSRHLHRVRF